MSKQLLPIYDKPMIYYPLSTLPAPEEIAWRHGWIDDSQSQRLAESGYGQYLLRVLKEKIL